MAGPCNEIITAAADLKRLFGADGLIPAPDTFSYLGMAIRRDRSQRQIWISQQAYAERVVEKFRITRGVSYPLEGPLTARNEESEEAGNIDLYRQHVRCLQYLALHSRPDLAYTAGVLGRYSANPSARHMDASMRALRYLQKTKSLALPLIHRRHNISNEGITVYTDADHGGDPDTSRSTTGYVLFVNSVLVDWKSKRQSVASSSTTKAEIIAANTGSNQAIWLKDLTTEMGYGDLKIRLLNDNAQCFQAMTKGQLTAATRHLRFRYHELLDNVESEKMEIVQVRDPEMMADGLTKAYKGSKQEKMLTDFGML